MIEMLRMLKSPISNLKYNKCLLVEKKKYKLWSGRKEQIRVLKMK